MAVSDTVVRRSALCLTGVGLRLALHMLASGVAALKGPARGCAQATTQSLSGNTVILYYYNGNTTNTTGNTTIMAKLTGMFGL